MSDKNVTTKPVAAAIGCFDGVHLGHRALLQRLKAEAQIVGGESMVVTFTKHPLELLAPDRAPAMLMTVEERQQALQAEGIDRVVMLEFTPELRSLTAAEFLAMLHSKYGVTKLVRGFNHHFGSDRLQVDGQYAQAGHEAGVEVLKDSEYRLPDGTPVSSSLIRKALLEGRATNAATMLGRPYHFDGKVVGGKHIGRTIDFPTANLSLEPGRLVPACGVYAVDTTLPDGSRHRGMMNIGSRPTLDDRDGMSIEVNIFDFEGNLYGCPVDIDLLARIRSEQRFDSLDALRSQLEADRRVALAIP